MGQKSPLQMQAYKYLKNMILTGKLEPDTLYSETRLSAEIGISRTPMREAVQCLSQDGYITVVPSKGFMIRKLSEADMNETIQIRCAIEGFCAYQAAEGVNSKKGQKFLNQLEKLLVKQEQALRGEGGPTRENIINGCVDEELMNQFMEFDHQFHFALIDYVENKEFHKIIQRSMYLIQLTTKEALSVPGRTEETYEEHVEFYNNLKNCNGEAAYKLLIKHLTAPLSMHLNLK